MKSTRLEIGSPDGKMYRKDSSTMTLGWKEAVFPVTLIFGAMILPPFAPPFDNILLPRNSGSGDDITGIWPVYMFDPARGYGVNHGGRLIATPDKTVLALYDERLLKDGVRLLVISASLKSVWASQPDDIRELVLSKLSHLMNVFANRMEAVIQSDAFRQDYLPAIKTAFRHSFSSMLSDPETIRAFEVAAGNFGATLSETVLDAYARAVVDVVKERLDELTGSVLLRLMGGELELPEMKGVLAEAAVHPLVLEAIHKAVEEFIETPDADKLAAAVVLSMASALREERELFVVLGRIASDPRFGADMTILEREVADVVVQVAHMIFPEATQQTGKTISAVIASSVLKRDDGIALLIPRPSESRFVGTTLRDFGAITPR